MLHWQGNRGEAHVQAQVQPLSTEAIHGGRAPRIHLGEAVHQQHPRGSEHALGRVALNRLRQGRLTLHKERADVGLANLEQAQPRQEEEDGGDQWEESAHLLDDLNKKEKTKNKNGEMP